MPVILHMACQQAVIVSKSYSFVFIGLINYIFFGFSSSFSFWVNQVIIYMEFMLQSMYNFIYSGLPILRPNKKRRRILHQSDLAQGQLIRPNSRAKEAMSNVGSLIATTRSRASTSESGPSRFQAQDPGPRGVVLEN